MNIITRNDSVDYLPDSRHANKAKIRKQIKFIKDFVEKFPRVVVAGGCVFDHQNDIPAKDIDIFDHSADVITSIIEAYPGTTVEAQRPEKEHPYDDNNITGVFMLTVPFGRYHFLVNLIVRSDINKPTMTERVIATLREFPVGMCRGVYWAPCGELIAERSDNPYAIFKLDLSAKTLNKYQVKTLLTLGSRQGAGGVPNRMLSLPYKANRPTVTDGFYLPRAINKDNSLRRPELHMRGPLSDLSYSLMSGYCAELVRVTDFFSRFEAAGFKNADSIRDLLRYEQSQKAKPQTVAAGSRGTAFYTSYVSSVWDSVTSTINSIGSRP